MYNARYTGHHRDVLQWVHNIMNSGSSGLSLLIATKANSDQETNTIIPRLTSDPANEFFG